MASNGHEFGRRRSDAAPSKISDAGTSTCSGDVRGRGGRAVDHRGRARPACGAAGDPDLGRHPCLRARLARPVARPSLRGHPDAGDDGRNLRVGRADARAHRRRQGGWRRRLRSDLAAPDRLWRGHQRGCLRHRCGAAHELPYPPVSRRRHRLDHSHHRRVADADRRRLGRRTACGSEYRRRRLQGHDSKSKPGRARRIRPVAGRAPRHSRRQQIRQGIRRQHLGVDRPRRRRRRGRGDGQDEFRGGRLGAGRRNRVALPVWHAPVLARADRDHVHRDGRRDDRVRPACSWRSAR